MKILLDTNAFIRLMAGGPLPRSVERTLAKPVTESFVSIVTGWEIVLKPKLGLRATDVEAGITEMGARLLPIRFVHLAELSALPLLGDHRDPFDRLLIAQAISEDLHMISSDTRFAGYQRVRVIWD